MLDQYLLRIRCHAFEEFDPRFVDIVWRQDLLPSRTVQTSVQASGSSGVAIADRPRLRYAIPRLQRTRILRVVDPSRPHLLQDTPVEIGILLRLAEFGSVPQLLQVFLGGIHARADRAFLLL